jgi:hypothetical protein
MMLALIKNGAIARYPYTVTDLRRDNPGTSFPAFPDADTLAAWNVVPVLVDPQPDMPSQQRFERAAPILRDGAWVQGWSIIDLTPAEIAERDKAAVPPSVSLWQFRTVLRLNGNFERVQYALARLQSPESILAAELFEYGNSIYRSSTLATELIKILGVTDEQVDALFIQAAQIKV